MANSARPNVRPILTDWQRLGPETRFHIDYSWWDRQNLSLESYLQSRLGGQAKAEADMQAIDSVDPVTAEVRQVSGFEFAIQRYFRQLPGDYLKNASVVDAIFYVLLANGNRPMNSAEIAAQIKRSPDVVLQMLSGNQVYQGIRAYREE